MHNPPMKVLSVQTGQARFLNLQGRRVRSAFGKQAVSGAVAVLPLGLQGDEQADLSVHGGLNKAVYAYPSEHYAFWQNNPAPDLLSAPDDLGTPPALPLPFGSLGENLSLQGLLETDVCVGDTLHFPHCVLRVTEPRQPCGKFTAIFGDPKAGKKMAQSGFCGFYLAVQEAGHIEAGQAFELRHGPRQTSIHELFKRAMFKTRGD